MLTPDIFGVDRAEGGFAHVCACANLEAVPAASVSISCAVPRSLCNAAAMAPDNLG